MRLLPLDSPRWHELDQAYGSAGNVPDMIRALEESGSSDLTDPEWDDLLGAVYHQGDVYGASFAVVPYVVDLANRVPPAEQAAHWTLVGLVASRAAVEDAPEELGYADALRESEPLIRAALPAVAEDDAAYLLQALAAVRGHLFAANLVGDFAVTPQFDPDCPECGFGIMVEEVDGRLLGWLRNPPNERARRKLALEPSRAPMPAVDADAPAWTPDAVWPAFHALARRAGHDRLATRLAACWDATVTCPNCDTRFSLLPTFADQVEQQSRGA